MKTEPFRFCNIPRKCIDRTPIFIIHVLGQLYSQQMPCHGDFLAIFLVLVIQPFEMRVCLFLKCGSYFSNLVTITTLILRSFHYKGLLGSVPPYATFTFTMAGFLNTFVSLVLHFKLFFLVSQFCELFLFQHLIGNRKTRGSITKLNRVFFKFRQFDGTTVKMLT